jgi:hypothetical protein
MAGGRVVVAHAEAKGDDEERRQKVLETRVFTIAPNERGRHTTQISFFIFRSILHLLQHYKKKKDPLKSEIEESEMMLM